MSEIFELDVTFEGLNLGDNQTATLRITSPETATVEVPLTGNVTDGSTTGSSIYPGGDLQTEFVIQKCQ